jgi:hypothetical protein
MNEALGILPWQDHVKALKALLVWSTWEGKRIKLNEAVLMIC